MCAKPIQTAKKSVIGDMLKNLSVLNGEFQVSSGHHGSCSFFGFWQFICRVLAIWKPLERIDKFIWKTTAENIATDANNTSGIELYIDGGFAVVSHGKPHE